MSCGRLVLPIEVRQKLGIEEKNNLTMFIDKDKLILQKGLAVDSLGRIAIPLHIRKTLGLEEEQELTVEVVGNQIILSK